MRYIVIDSLAQTVTEVHSDMPSLEFMQKAVGGYIELATDLPNGDDLFVDEEGLLKPLFMFFEIEGGHHPFAGNGVVSGRDEDGNTIDAKSTVEEIRAKVKFKNVYQVRNEQRAMG